MMKAESLNYHVTYQNNKEHVIITGTLGSFAVTAAEKVLLWIFPTE